ncbi:MAG: 2-oxoacid:acceptor oxidoreductase family protein [Candidatus Bathyarchaeota archaeon]|nr:2-oxoacid:acceptor oxidoreductase family protein [Candidatus Bathyarchaeota archaeon]
MQQNILISGTGGQGVIASGEFLSSALFMKDYEIMFSRSYGASARGGACMSQIMAADHVINDLQFEASDILLCLSLPAFKKYMPMAKKGSLIIVDTHVYERADKIRDDVVIIQVPARDIAVKLGNQIVANMVMLGALSKRSEMVNLELLKEAVNTNMRESMRDINLKALQQGHDSV